ncbi:MAG: ATP phosphoribosyltransferase [Hyphomicrobiales bacterium]
MAGKVKIAIPSKGRLMEKATGILNDAGFAVERAGNDRGYRGKLSGIENVDVEFLSASEIASRLQDGSIQAGITGEDLLRETIHDFDDRVDIAKHLGFGRADVVVAAPECWLDVQNMADLDEVSVAYYGAHKRRMRVATKYLNLTRRFFASKGVTRYRIVESLGATEGAPAAGTAQVIVDITSTGSTLQANHLRILNDGVILKSQACLAVLKNDKGASEVLKPLLAKFA